MTAREKWPYRTLKWKLDRLGEHDQFIIRHTLHRAFDIWASVSSLRFIEVVDDRTQSPDIVISFKRRSHGDDQPFDGPRGEVAHAFYPPIGRIHFDEEEHWTLNQASGVNFYQVSEQTCYYVSWYPFIGCDS